MTLMRDCALIHVNGMRRKIRGREAMMMVAEWLRKESGLTGTKIVCAEGDCGACTVLRAVPIASEQGDASTAHPLRFEMMNSCIVLMAQLDGAHIVTVEGMQCGGVLSPAQEAMRVSHASQCGYCTPGFVMAMSDMLERHACADAKTCANYLTGNLCRCTGYTPILEAATTMRATETHSVAARYSNRNAIEDSIRTSQQSMLLESDGVTFFSPATLREAVTFAAKNPNTRVIAAATDLGVQVNKGAPLPRAMLSLHLIDELDQSKITRRGLKCGARVTLAQVRRLCDHAAPEFARFLDLFASPQIKNVATLVGNIANASPIGDTLPFLLIAGGKVHVASRPDGRGPLRRRVIPMTELYLGYRTLALTAGEIITHVSFDRTAPREMLRLYKVSQRKDLDISAVSCALSVTRKSVRRSTAAPIILSARIAFGGVAATPVRMRLAEQALCGELTTQRIEAVAQLIEETIEPISDLRASGTYRRVTAANLFRRYGHEVLHG